MIETLDKLKHLALEFLDSVISSGAEWYARFQTEEQLQHLVLTFLIGAVIGWFSKSFFLSRKKKANTLPGNKAGGFRYESGKSKEEVELNARRRL